MFEFLPSSTSPVMLKSRAAPAANPLSSEDAMKQALLAVVSLWEDRLQKQGIVTTWFCSIDSILFSLTSGTRASSLSDWSSKDMVINGTLGGAIIFHVCASIVAYIASFMLIRYKLNDAEKKEEEIIRTSTQSRATSSSQQHTTRDTEKRRKRSSSHAHQPSASMGSTLGPGSPIDTLAEFPIEVFTDLRGLVSVYRTQPLWFLRCGGRRGGRDWDKSRPRGDPEASIVDSAIVALQGMLAVLARAHTACVYMSSAGFVLALLGILTYAWTEVPLALSIFASACMGACGIVACIALW